MGSEMALAITGIGWRRLESCPLGADRGAQFVYNLAGGDARCFLFVDVERDGANPSMPPSSVALADLGQVDDRLGRRPGIRSHGNFHPKTALAQSHAVDRFRVQIVWNEFVVTLEFVIGDIEEQRAIFRLDAVAKNSHR